MLCIVYDAFFLLQRGGSMNVTYLTNKGITLVEIVVSVSILSIILITFGSIFVNMNKTSISNNEKLVAVHLAKGTLDRLKVDPGYYNEKLANGEAIIEEINEKRYRINIQYLPQTAENIKAGLKPVLIEVKLDRKDYPVSASVEGYVEDEK